MSFDRPSSAPDDASADGRRPGSGRDADWLDDADGASEDAVAAKSDDELRADDQHDAGGYDELLGDDGSDDGVLYEDQVQPEYGIIGFTLRELIIIGAWLVGFLVSFFPIGPIGDSVWTSGIHWILMMGVPTAAVFLVVLRRLSPEGIRRVGSLGIDQFASVAASVAAVAWAQVLWQQIAATVATGAFLIGWAAIVGQVAMLVLVAVTVFGPFLPRLRDDFHGRLETLAHRNANPVRPVIARPRPEPEVTSSPVGAAGAPRREADGESAPGDTIGREASEPRVETALTVVISDAQTSRQHGAAEAGQAPESDGDQVLYNTAAVEALRDIFSVDETTNPRRPVEHNTAPDGVSGSDISRLSEPHTADSADTTSLDAHGEPPLRRSRDEQSPDSAGTELPGSAPRAAEPVVDSAAPAVSRPEPFWILAPTERDVLDEHGEPLFRVGPTAWALAIEDRGGAFVVRHEDGRIGYLHDISDITKG